jgi:hypothetical protein
MQHKYVSSPSASSSLFTCLTSARVGCREVGLMLFRTLAEFVGDALKPQFNVYEEFFIRCMKVWVFLSSFLFVVMRCMSSELVGVNE